MKIALALAIACVLAVTGAQAQQAKPAKQPAAKAKTAAPGTRPHVLQGSWKIYWLDQKQVTEMEITQVFPGKGTTNLVGAIVMLSGAMCPLTGTVSDAMTGEIVDGIEKRIITTNAFVTLKAQCPDRQLWIEALGLPSGTYLMNGRATQIDAANVRAFGAVALGR